MTINSPTRTAGPYSGNGSTATYSFNFRVFAATDLQVIRAYSGTEFPLVLTTDYTVSLNANQLSNPGGSITLTGGNLPTGYTLTILSNIPNLQPADFQNTGGFYPEVLNDSLDRATMQIQQLGVSRDRTVRVPMSDAAPSLVLPTALQRANSYLAFDGNGNCIAVDAGASGSPTTIVRQNFSGDGVNKVFTLTTAAGAGNSTQVYIAGVYQNRSTYSVAGTTLTFSTAPVAGTNNIEFINFLTNSIGTTDASLVTYTGLGTGVVSRTAAQKFGELGRSVFEFGAVGDGSTDDAAAFAAAWTASNPRPVFVPSGSYKITGTVSGTFYGVAPITISGGGTITINQIGSTLSTSGNATVTGNANISGNATVTGNLVANGTITGSTVGAIASSLLPTGCVLQVVTATTSTAATTTTLTTWANTNLTANITPRSASSRIVVMANNWCSVGLTTAGTGDMKMGLRIARTISGTTTNMASADDLLRFTTATSMTKTIAAYQPILWLDSPSTISAITYTIQYQLSAGSTATHSGATNPSSIILAEIA